MLPRLACAAVLGATAYLTPAARLAAQDLGGPLSRFAQRKAETLLRDALPCLGCHQLNGEGGRLGSELSMVRNRRSASFIAAVVSDPQRVMPGTPMPRVVMPAATRDLIIRYLVSRPPGAQPTATSPVPSGALPEPRPAAPDAAALYSRFCAACHGARGHGDGPNAPYLPVKPAAHASGALMSQRSDDALFDTIFGGGAVMGRSPRMPGFGGTLSRLEIESLVRYLRTLCSCRGPAWSTGAEAGGRPARK